MEPLSFLQRMVSGSVGGAGAVLDRMTTSSTDRVESTRCSTVGDHREQQIFPHGVEVPIGVLSHTGILPGRKARKLRKFHFFPNIDCTFLGQASHGGEAVN